MQHFLLRKTVLNLPGVGKAKETILTSKISNDVCLIEMLHVLIGLDVASLSLLDPQLEQFHGMLCNCNSNPWQAAKIVPMLPVMFLE